MSFFSDIMGVVNSWITAKGKVTELKYKRRMIERDNKQSHKKQWDRLFCSEDYNSIKILQKFIDGDNEWIKIDENFKRTLSSVKFCGLYNCDRVEIYFDGEKFPLFQLKTEEEVKYIRIVPKIYPEFRKQYNLYQKKRMI